MKLLDWGSGGIRASVLALGCASMMGRRNARDSRRALDSAFDSGINFFDVARSYGYGQAEALLGQFARGKRDKLVIATKFGIDPDPSPRANAIRLLQGGMGGFRHLEWSRSGASKEDPMSAHWAPNRLRATLQRSLGELRTDYADILWLHSPPAEITRNAELFAELDRLKAEGLIRAYGLSGGAREASRALAIARYGIASVQHAFCPLTGTVDVVGNPPPAVMLNHIFGGRGGLRSAAEWIGLIESAPRVTSAMRGKIGSADAGKVLTDILINGALAAAGARFAAVSMFNPEHIAANCAVAGESRFTREELVALAGALGEQT